jgi:hypothetical protein
MELMNRDKRSILLSLILGDGCLHLSSPSQHNKMGYISIKHGYKQKDYVEWKARMVSHVLNKEIKVHSAISKVKALDKEYDQFKIQFGQKRMRSWRKFCYPNNKKSLRKILPFIRHDIFAAAVWLMDDGTVRTAPKKDTTERICVGMTLYLGDVFREEAEYAQKWFLDTFGVQTRLKWQKVKYKGSIREYPELIFHTQEALFIWSKIRNEVLAIPSMVHKFRAIEKRFHRIDLLQPQTHLDKFIYL